MEYLKKAGIGSGIHYPIPLHLQKAYLSLNYHRGDFPVTEQAAAEIVSLPMYPHLGHTEQQCVVENVLEHLSLNRKLAGSASSHAGVV